MRLLFIAHRIPYPPNKGDKIRSYNELLFLSRHFEIDLVCFMDDPMDERYLPKLAALCKSISIFKRGNLFKFWHLIQGFLTAQPLSKALYDHPQMHKSVEALLQANTYHRIFIFSGQMSQYVPEALLPNAVIDFCDVDSHKWDNYAERMPFYLSWLYRLEAHRLFAFEAEAAKTALAALFITPAELQLFRNLGGEGRILALGNGVDTEFFAPRPETPVYGRILFTGAMDYFPNEEGVSWFAKEVFPELRNKMPSAQFIIAGSNPSPKVKALARIEGVTVTGFVKDMRLEQAKAHIVVVPLRIARGMQNKVLEAMACGKAVVVCTQALGGIYAVPGKDLMVADEAGDFRKCIETLLTEPQVLEAMGIAARNYILTNLSWERNLSQDLLPLLAENTASK
jgi:sugar transferase (PEP-CTERM/EpsH1 system associated)